MECIVMVKLYWGVDGRGSTYVEWEIAPGCHKRAWVQHREGDRDWAGTGRYVNVTRVEGLHMRPAGMPSDFPVFRTEACDRRLLEDFVTGICAAVGR
jgi:hypothetical protein